MRMHLLVVVVFITAVDRQQRQRQRGVIWTEFAGGQVTYVELIFNL